MARHPTTPDPAPAADAGAPATVIAAVRRVRGGWLRLAGVSAAAAVLARLADAPRPLLALMLAAAAATAGWALCWAAAVTAAAVSGPRPVLVTLTGVGPRVGRRRWTRVEVTAVVDGATVRFTGMATATAPAAPAVPAAVHAQAYGDLDRRLFVLIGPGLRLAPLLPRRTRAPRLRTDTSRTLDPTGPPTGPSNRPDIAAFRRR